MDSLKIKTLEQVSDASEIVESARADHSLSQEDKFKLEAASVKLRHMERAIIKIVQQELVDTLTADSKALQELSDQIKKSSDRLSSVAASIEKAAKAVEAFVKVITAVAASGLL